MENKDFIESVENIPLFGMGHNYRIYRIRPILSDLTRIVNVE